MNQSILAHALRALAIPGIFSVLVLAGGCQSAEARRDYESTSYYDGLWCRNISAGLEDVRGATLVALTELKMPVFREGPFRRGIYIDTRTIDNYDVRIELRRLHPRRQFEPPVTQVGVRVSGFGTHQAICDHLLDEIVRRLMSMPPAPVIQAPGPQSLPPTPPAGLPSQPVPVEH
jgi:hypothetical protein